MEKYSNKTNKFSIEQVVTLDIDSTGSVTQRLTNLETTLENTLLNALYPGIKVAVVNVPNEPLDAYEESQVENAMANLKFKNTPYKLVGASGSSKDGKFYFVDRDHSQSDSRALPALATGSHRLLRHPGLLLQGGDRGTGRIGAGG